MKNWKHSRDRFLEIVRRIQEANKNADLDEVMQDMLEAQQAVRAAMLPAVKLSSEIVLENRPMGARKYFSQRF
jgi:hypothetical protein